MLTDNSKLVVNTDPQTVEDLQTLAQSLNTNINGVLSQAIALLMLVQGSQVFLRKDNDVEIEIKNYKDKKPTRFWGGK